MFYQTDAHSYLALVVLEHSLTR